MFKQKNYIAAGVVVVAAVFILSLPSSATSHLKLALGSLFLPLFGLANAGQQLPADLADSALPRRELLHEVANLRAQVQQLQLAQLQAQATAQENDRFRDLYAWQKQQPWKFKLARVITRDPANWWRTIRN